MLKVSFLAGSLSGLLNLQPARATNDPFTGYNNSSYYFLPYAGNTSFAPGSTQDVRVAVTIAGKEHVFNVDTGSRGLYASSTELGPDFTIGPNSFPGEIDLDSSGRVSYGTWTQTSLSFKVTDQNNAPQVATATAYILDVTTLGAQEGRTASFGVNTKVKGYNGTVKLVGGGTIAVTQNSKGDPVVVLSHVKPLNQQISYADNIPGLINNVSNFGIGFDLSGKPTGTGPVVDNENQIYNVLINLDDMRNGTLVGGYIITPTGIQLGLTSKDTGYAYTMLNSTGLLSAYTAPDWQTPMGQTVVNGVTNQPGSIVMDSGIPNAFLAAPNLKIGDKITKPMKVYLMNSGGTVGYNIDVSDSTNDLNPESVLVVKHGTGGTYSQGQPPYQTQFFNTGRHVFEAFNMLYDAQNGYMGVLPTAYGAKNPNVFFKAQAGGYPDPIQNP